jgi:pyrroloquinoline quinone biosynthesis protein D
MTCLKQTDPKTMSEISLPPLPKIAPGFRFQFEPAQQSHVLLFPEGMIKLNGPAAEILKRCNGTSTIDAITQDLQLTFNQANLSHDVHSFLTDALQRGWIA